MYRVLLSLMLCAACLVPSKAQASIIANSELEFSDTQGQDNWFYGFFNQGLNPLTPYMTSAFQQFGVFDILANRWEATDTQVGANNNDFLNINSVGGHPTGVGPGGQDNIIWAIRRYESPVQGLLKVEFDLRKTNVSEPRGGGITGRVFVDGVEVFSQFIANADDTQLLRTIYVNADVGTLIDFAIDPTGMAPPDSEFSARADGSRFSSEISAVPEPSTFAIFSFLGVILFLSVRKKRAAATKSESL